LRDSADDGICANTRRKFRDAGVNALAGPAVRSPTRKDPAHPARERRVSKAFFREEDKLAKEQEALAVSTASCGKCRALGRHVLLGCADRSAADIGSQEHDDKMVGSRGAQCSDADAGQRS